MLAYQGYFENGQFVSLDAVKVPDQRRVILTVLDEIVQKPSENKQAGALREFFDAINASDEEVPEIFERVKFSREIDI